MSLVRRPGGRPVARAWWLATIADPAWVAVALTVVARAIGIRDPARTLAATLAMSTDGGGHGGGGDGGRPRGGRPSEQAEREREEAERGTSSERPAWDGAGADDEIDLTGGTGMTGTTTGGLVGGGMTLGPTTTGTSAPADAATTPYPAPPVTPSTGDQGGTGKGRSPMVGTGGLNEAPGANDPRLPALADDEAGTGAHRDAAGTIAGPPDDEGTD